MKAITSRLIQDVAVRDQRMAKQDAAAATAMAERDAALAGNMRGW